MEERKRKRIESNRESARRSRMRKRHQMNDLMNSLKQLKKENNQILNNISIIAQHGANVEFENLVLSAQMVELSQRLQSLNDMLTYITFHADTVDPHLLFNYVGPSESFITNPWNLMYHNS